MKTKLEKAFAVFVSLCLVFSLYAQGVVPVIPQPRQAELLAGTFDVSKGVKIACDKELGSIVSLFNESLTVNGRGVFPT